MNLGALKRLCAVLAIALFVANYGAAQTAVSNPPRKKTAPSASKAKADASSEDARAIGSKTAPITMEVFSDYECPACRELYLQTLRPLIENYVNTGKVYLVHRDMPLAIHQYSRNAARYANAAARVNRSKFERVVEALYLNRDKWAGDGNIDAVVAPVMTPAEMKKVRALVNGGTLDAGIESDVALGNKFRVTQTPTTILTHRGQTYPIIGVMSYNVLRRFLDDLLVGKS